MLKNIVYIEKLEIFNCISPRAAVTNNHKTGLKQQTFILFYDSLGDQASKIKVLQAWFLLESLRENHMMSLS